MQEREEVPPEGMQCLFWPPGHRLPQAPDDTHLYAAEAAHGPKRERKAHQAKCRTHLAPPPPDLSSTQLSVTSHYYTPSEPEELGAQFYCAPRLFPIQNLGNTPGDGQRTMWY